MRAPGGEASWTGAGRRTTSISRSLGSAVQSSFAPLNCACARFRSVLACDPRARGRDVPEGRAERPGGLLRIVDDEVVNRGLAAARPEAELDVHRRPAARDTANRDVRIALGREHAERERLDEAWCTRSFERPHELRPAPTRSSRASLFVNVPAAVRSLRNLRDRKRVALPGSSPAFPVATTRTSSRRKRSPVGVA